MEQTLRVKNLISSRYMQDICRVVAGKGGLGNSVSWVHILEIRDVVKDSVDEGALILTTGIGFTTKDVAVKFLCDLIESRAAGLCIETVLYYPVIDRELIEIADKEEFPLVEIYAIARFLDVSKGLNTMILNNESVLYGDAEVFDSGLANIRHIGSLEDGLRYTGEYLGVDVVFYPGEESLGTALSEAGCEVDIAPHEISSYIKRDGVFANGKIAVKKIEAFSHCFGYLVFSSATKKIDRFALLIQGRVSNHIKEQNMRILIRKEEEWRKRTKWVREWLDGNITENQIARKLREAGMFKVWQCIFVCCMEFPPTYSFAEQALCPPENDIFLYDNFFRLNTFLVRRSFEKSGFSVLEYIHKQYMHYIVLSDVPEVDSISRVKDVVSWLRQYQNPFVNYQNVYFSVGKMGKSYHDVHKSRKTALALMFEYPRDDSRFVCYDELYIEHVLVKLSRPVLEEFVDDTLKELTEPQNAELRETLRVYFECNCSKQEAANKLFVVRQTLYFRLAKIGNMLGADFASPGKRQAIEFALHAHRYMRDVYG